MNLKHLRLFILILLIACDGKKQTEKQEIENAQHDEHELENLVELTQAQYEIAGIELGSTQIRSISDVIMANGVIDIPPSNLVSISAPMGGFVRKTELLQGMKVKKGQILATIENPDFIQIQQDYLETESELTYAETELARQEQLSSENVGAQKIFQQATAQAKMLKARLAGLRERLKTAGINLRELEKGIIVNHANIISPLTGSVTAVNVNIGKYVTPTDVMFEIVDTDHLHVELSVYEKDISRLKIGQTVRFTINNDASRERVAEVYLINPLINEDRTVRVHCHLEKDDPALLPRNYVRATIETGSNQLPSLPDQAIMDFEGKSYVFVEKGKEDSSKKAPAYIFEMIEVQKGVSENGFTHVTLLEEIKESRIVLKGAYSLLSKMKNSESEGHGH